jgi:Carboxypeptidase regulatory-like domain
VAKPARTYFLDLLVPAFSLVAATTAFAQSPGGGPVAAGETYATIVVSVRENTGAPLQNGPFVRLSSDFSGLRLTATTQDGGASTFPSIRSGEYQVEVSSVGYRTTTERASVLPGNSSYNVHVYMMPEGGPIGSAAPAGTTMLVCNPRSTKASTTRRKKRREKIETTKYVSGDQVHAIGLRISSDRRAVAGM